LDLDRDEAKVERRGGEEGTSRWWRSDLLAAHYIGSGEGRERERPKVLADTLLD
jgi:hypothetical protein